MPDVVNVTAAVFVPTAKVNTEAYHAFTKEVDKATIGYYNPKLEQMLPGLECRIRQSGVDELRRVIGLEG